MLNYSNYSRNKMGSYRSNTWVKGNVLLQASILGCQGMQREVKSRDSG